MDAGSGAGWAGCECPGCGKALVEDLHDAGSCFYVSQVCDVCGEVGWLQRPRTTGEVVALVEAKVISRAEARRYLRLR